jgi:hypothetical protein
MGWPLAATSLTAGALAFAGLLHCARVFRSAPRGPRRAVAAAGVALNLFAIVLVAGLAIPTAWLEPCL